MHKEVQKFSQCSYVTNPSNIKDSEFLWGHYHKKNVICTHDIGKATANILSANSHHVRKNDTNTKLGKPTPPLCLCIPLSFWIFDYFFSGHIILGGWYIPSAKGITRNSDSLKKPSSFPIILGKSQQFLLRKPSPCGKYGKNTKLRQHILVCVCVYSSNCVGLSIVLSLDLLMKQFSTT